VHGGYLQVETGLALDAGEARAPRVTLLAGTAAPASQIDVARAERARAEAEARVEELRAALGRVGATGTGPTGTGPTGTGHAHAERVGATPEDIELAEAEAALERAKVRLEVAGAS